MATESESVFLAYPGDQHALAQQIVAGLEAKGHTVWFDGKLGASSPFNTIQDALAAAHTFVALIPEDARAHQYLLDEIAMALDQQQAEGHPRIIAAYLAGTPPVRRRPYGLQRYPGVDLRGAAPREAAERLLAALREEPVRAPERSRPRRWWRRAAASLLICAGVTGAGISGWREWSARRTIRLAASELESSTRADQLALAMEEVKLRPEPLAVPGLARLARSDDFALFSLKLDAISVLARIDDDSARKALLEGAASEQTPVAVDRYLGVLPSRPPEGVSDTLRALLERDAAGERLVAMAADLGDTRVAGALLAYCQKRARQGQHEATRRCEESLGRLVDRLATTFTADGELARWVQARPAGARYDRLEPNALLRALAVRSAWDPDLTSAVSEAFEHDHDPYVEHEAALRLRRAGALECRRIVAKLHFLQGTPEEHLAVRGDLVAFLAHQAQAQVCREARAPIHALVGRIRDPAQPELIALESVAGHLETVDATLAQRGAPGSGAPHEKDVASQRPVSQPRRTPAGNRSTNESGRLTSPLH